MQDLQEILDSKSSVPNNQTNPNNQDNQETNDAPNSWHVADIYPSHKLHEMIYFLFGLIQRYICDEQGKNRGRAVDDIKQEYFEMMDSYVIYANYINLCCSVQIEPSWNIKIGNLYVYDYKKTNLPEPPKTFKLDLTPMINETIKKFAEEFSRIGLTKGVSLSKFWDELSSEVKDGLKSKYKSRYLEDLTPANLVDNLERIIYYIRKKKIDEVQIRWIIILFKKLEESDGINRLQYAKYRRLIGDIYNRSIGTIYLSPCTDGESSPALCPFPEAVLKNIEVLKKVHEALINFIDRNEDNEEYYETLESVVNDAKIFEDKYIFREFILIIKNVALYHYRTESFFTKIEKILNNCKAEMKEILSVMDIINIFEDCPRILLYLIKNKTIQFNECVYDSCRFSDYVSYFITEIGSYVEEKKETLGITMSENYGEANKDEMFETKREKGENDTTICELIRDDKIDDFIKHINTKHIKENGYIEESSFETNPLLKKSNVSLIQYSAFFGATNIFNYLSSRESVILDSSIWEYAIHGENLEIVKIIEDKKIEFHVHNATLLESLIQCHNPDIFNYFKKNYYDVKKNNQKLQERIYGYSLKYRNYTLVSSEAFRPSFLLKCIYEYNLIDTLKKLEESKKITFDEHLWRAFALKFSTLDVLKLAMEDPTHSYNKATASNPQADSSSSSSWYHNDEDYDYDWIY